MHSSTTGLNTLNRSTAARLTAATIASLNNDDSLSYAEIGLLMAAFSTLACSMLLSVIIP